MKTLFFLAAVLCLVSVALASGGIRIGIPLPFIKIRFMDIANLFGHEGHHGGHHGGAQFGLQIGGGGHHGHGW